MNVIRSHRSPDDHRFPGLADLPQQVARTLVALGTSAGLLSVLVVTFYIKQPQTTLLYAKPERLWVLCAVLLYWISRMWLVAHRGNMQEDPLDFALRDGPSYIVLGVLAAIAYAAI